MPVEPRTHAAIVVDGSATHGAWRAARADDRRRMGGQRLHQCQADQLAGGTQLEVEGALSRFADRAGGDPGDLLEVEAARSHRCYSPAGFPPLEKEKAGRWGNGPQKRGREDRRTLIFTQFAA